MAAATAATVVDANGYGVPKTTAFFSEGLEAARATLTVRPRSMMDDVVFASGASEAANPSFPVYMETPDTMYVPKAYGLKRFGVPSRNALPEGTDIDVAFEGALRPEQEGPATSFLAAAKDPSRAGGLINLRCAGGKTVIALYIVSKLGKKALIVCHKEFLIEQWRQRIAQFLPTARVGTIKAKRCEVEDADIVIASLQSLAMKKYDPVTFDSFALSIYDECHHTSAAVFSRVFRVAATRYTLGLSATLVRKDGLTRVFKWHIGDVVHDVAATAVASASETGTDMGMRVEIETFKDASPAYCREHSLFGGRKPNASRMINNICAYEKRTAHIVSRVLALLAGEDERRKVLVLSDRRSHLEAFKTRLEAAGVGAGLYYGGMKREALEESERQRVLLGTYAYVSEGFDNKELNTLVLASPKSDVVQVVGRILRTPPAERVCRPLVVDVVDAFSIFPSQAKRRQRYYASQGFEVDVMDKGGSSCAPRGSPNGRASIDVETAPLSLIFLNPAASAAPPKSAPQALCLIADDDDGDD